MRMIAMSDNQHATINTAEIRRAVTPGPFLFHINPGPEHAQLIQDIGPKVIVYFVGCHPSTVDFCHIDIGLADNHISATHSGRLVILSAIESVIPTNLDVETSS